MSALSPARLWPFLALLLAILTGAGAACAEPAVGFTTVKVPDATGAPIEVGIWYPSAGPVRAVRLGLGQQTVAPGGAIEGAGLPLIVLSHGNGGWFGGHYDTALALAAAGFVVAAPTHTGDNYADQSRALDLPDRPRQLHVVIDWMLASWDGQARLDPGRVGAFGFSSGGFTVLVAAGGEPDLAAVAPHCQAHPDFYDCQLMAAHGAPTPRPVAWVHDSRIRAVVSAAPALGFAFSKPGLAKVTQPVQLWRAEEDAVLPNPFYAEAVRQALPVPPELHLVPGAGHYDFLAPCDADLKAQVPAICASLPGFDRAAFHRDFNAAVVAFFQRTLPARGGASK